MPFEGFIPTIEFLMTPEKVDYQEMLPSGILKRTLVPVIFTPSSSVAIFNTWLTHPRGLVL
jgi:hypothetical protein